MNSPKHFDDQRKFGSDPWRRSRTRVRGWLMCGLLIARWGLDLVRLSLAGHFGFTWPSGFILTLGGSMTSSMKTGALYNQHHSPKVINVDASDIVARLRQPPSGRMLAMSWHSHSALEKSRAIMFAFFGKIGKLFERRQFSTEARQTPIIKVRTRRFKRFDDKPPVNLAKAIAQ
jgi:hypothetical protein